MKRLLIATALLGAVGASPAYATLQIAFTDGTTTVTCADGGLCDFAGGTSNLLTLNTDVGAFHIFGTLSMSTFGTTNNLSLSSFGVVNQGSTEGHLTMVVSDTNFTAPVTNIHESASLTFNNDVGAGASTLKFWADHADTQGAGNPILTPGPLQFAVSGVPLTNPDSFSGTATSSFANLLPFSMTEGATLDLLGGSSVTGFNQDMVSVNVPEARTWVMSLVGFGLLGLVGFKRRKDRQFASL